MFKYKTSDGLEFTCSEPIIGGQEAIDILGKFLADKTGRSESVKLKPCPFCGGKARPEHYDSEGYLPMCSVDGCSGMVEKWFDTEKEAAAAWNRRTAWRGSWVKPSDEDCTQCSICGFSGSDMYHDFCPGCGADMRGDEE